MNKITENPDSFMEEPLAGLKNDALSMVDKCIECGSCYLDCAFENYSKDPEECRTMIRESNDYISGNVKSINSKLMDMNLSCAECNRCYESCPEGIYRRHGNMYMKHLTGNSIRHRINIHPYSNWQIKQPAIEKFIVNKWKDDEREWYNKLNEIKSADVLLYHGCYTYLMASQCIKLEKMLDAAGISYVTIGKLEYCCGTFAFYRGQSDMGSIRPRFLDLIEQVGPKRIITNCGHCFNAMCDLSKHVRPDQKFDVRHAAEELLDLNISGHIDFAHLERTYTIHDSCNFRQLQNQDGPLRSLLKRMGGIHELLSHGRQGQCCGDVSRYFNPEHTKEHHRKTRVKEFISSEVEKMVTVCAGCYENFYHNPKLKIVDLIDLAYEAFSVARSEEIPKEKPLQAEWENMSPLISEE